MSEVRTNFNFIVWIWNDIKVVLLIVPIETHLTACDNIFHLISDLFIARAITDPKSIGSVGKGFINMRIMSGMTSMWLFEMFKTVCDTALKLSHLIYRIVCMSK